MRKLRNNLFGIFWGLFACVFNTPMLKAANGDITALQGGGVLNNVDVWRIDSTGNIFISTYNATNFTNVPHTTISNQGVITHTNNDVIAPTGTQFFGTVGVAYSTAIISGSSQGNMFVAFLASGTLSQPAVEGSVLIATTTQNNFITVAVAPATNGSNLTTVVGIADAAASTGTFVNIHSNGWVMALTTGTVSAGDILVSTQVSAGYLATNNSATVNTKVGTALQSGNSAGGLIRIKLF